MYTHTHTHKLVANYPVIYPAPVALTTQTKNNRFPGVTAANCSRMSSSRKKKKKKALVRAIRAAPWLQHNTLLCVSSFGEKYFKFYKSSCRHRPSAKRDLVRKPQGSFPFFLLRPDSFYKHFGKVFIHCVYTDSSIPVMIRLFRYLVCFFFVSAYPDLIKQDKSLSQF